MKTLAELKAANLPYATFDDFFTAKADANPSGFAAMKASADEYLQAFVLMGDECRCIRCDAQQNGLIAGFTGTGFTWGLAHGEGYCGTCHYPGRAHHNIPGLGRVTNFILQYHPAGLEERKADEEV